MGMRAFAHHVPTHDVSLAQPLGACCTHVVRAQRVADAGAGVARHNGERRQRIGDDRQKIIAGKQGLAARNDRANDPLAFLPPAYLEAEDDEEPGRDHKTGDGDAECCDEVTVLSIQLLRLQAPVTPSRMPRLNASTIV